MKIVNLEPAERRVLVCLVNRLVRADGVLSEEEIDAISGVADAMPLEAWREALQEVGGVGLGEGTLAEIVAPVTRPAARSLILHVLGAVAAADGIDPAERRMIHEVAHIWG